jgi:hypothetical protein
MRGKEIKAVVRLLDQDRDYFQLESKGKAKRRRELSLAERLAMADSDPAFLWNLAVTDALAGHPLPSFVCNSSALRANCFYLYPEHPDIHIAVVQSLGLPRMKPRRNLLRALICCADISLEGIAQACGLEVDEVRLYSELRWNFRDRVREGLYLAELLYPATRFAGPKVRALEQADAGLRLCRLGYEKGYRPVLQAAGPDRLEESPRQMADGARKISGSIIMRAGLGFDMGLTSSESNWELKLAQQTKLLSVEKLGQPTDDLSAMSVSTACYTSFMRIMQPELERRVAFQQGLMEEGPSKSEKTAAETGTIEPNQPPSGQAEGTRAI